MIDSETFNTTNDGTAADYIIWRMMDARYASLDLRQIVRFPRTSLPSSFFVVTSRKTGHVLFDAPRPLPWVRCNKTGRLYVDIGTLHDLQDNRVFKYNSRPFEEQNMWNHVLPFNQSSTHLVARHPHLEEHIDN